MEWIIFALLAPVIWGFNNIVLKVLISSKFKKPFPFLILTTFIDMIFVLAVSFLVKISFVFPYSLFAILIASLNIIPFWLYFKSLRIEEVSRITSLAQIVPIFVAILSAIFLNEILMIKQYFGIILIVIASMLISYRNIRGRKYLSPALKFMIIFALVASVQSILMKYTLGYMEYLSFFFWQGIGFLTNAIILLLFSKIRKDFVKIITTLDKKTFSTLFLNEGLWISGSLASLIAISIGYISLVSSIGALLPLFVLIYTIVLSLLIPRVLKEEISKFNIAQKLFAIFLIFVGMWLLNVL